MIGVEHNFETAHRLPFLGGKCENLHGHSWKVKIHFLNLAYESGMNSQGISAEYGLLKEIVRGWIDDKLDHGCMLGGKDSLLPALLDDNSKVYVFGSLEGLGKYRDPDTGTREYYDHLVADDQVYPHLPWPTVEAVAQMVCEEIQRQVDLAMPALGVALKVESVEVRETATNTFLWIPKGEVKEPSDRSQYSASAAALRGEDVHP